MLNILNGGMPMRKCTLTSIIAPWLSHLLALVRSLWSVLRTEGNADISRGMMPQYTVD